MIKLLWGGHPARPSVPHSDKMCCRYFSLRSAAYPPLQHCQNLTALPTYHTELSSLISPYTPHTSHTPQSPAIAAWVA
jgi:hypothetical protein